MFNLIINSYALRDLTLNGGLYTWSNNHEDPTLEKLDRCLMSENWESLFPLSNLRKIPRYSVVVYRSRQNQEEQNLQF